MATESNLFAGSGGNRVAVHAFASEASAARDLLADTIGTKPDRPTKYPIPSDVFERLKRAAQKHKRTRDLRSEDADTKTETTLKVSVFDGIAATNLSPPDCQIAVSENHVLVAVNAHFQLFDKKAKPLPTWFQKPAILFGQALPKGAFLFDPRVVFDHYARRWIALFAATRQMPKGAWLMLAVSQTDNPTEGWWTYALDSTQHGDKPSETWGDYPALGFDAQAVYITTNQFAWGKGFAESKLRILNKAEILAGKPAQWFDYWGLKNADMSAAFTVQPCVHYQAAQHESTAAFYLLNTYFPEGKALTFWTLENPLAFWQGQNPTLLTDTLPCKAYSLPPQAMQKGVKNKIFTNDVRLLCALSELRHGKTQLLTCHTTAHSWAGDKAGRSAINWYDIDPTTKTIVQQNTFGQAGFYYFFPAIHTDSLGNIYLLFARSGEKNLAETAISLQRTGLKNAILEGSKNIRLGESPYKGGRWGDYFGLCRDPSDSTSLWFVSEYAAAKGKWGTVIGQTFIQ
jgi:hypothetical protein